MPKVSVIIPIYNSESVLARCIESILSQKMNDFELILIDDGSSDGSLDICTYYSRIDKRIKVRHQENKGASAARNTGLEVSVGTYIAFCDSDDIVSENWLDNLLELSGTNKLAIGAYCDKQTDLGHAKEIGIEKGKNYNRSEYFIFMHAGIAGYLCNALYCREIVNQLHLRLRTKKEEGDYNEDLIFAVTYVHAVDTIAYTGYSDYYYDKHKDSLSHRFSKYYFDKYAEKYRIWQEFIEEYCFGNSKLLCQLSTEYLYFFLEALRKTKSIKEISRIVLSEEMTDCINTADTRAENRYEILMLKNKKCFLLYWFYKLTKRKEYF